MRGDELIRQHRERQKAEMRQYSLAVRWMKVLLPVAAVVLIGLIFLTGEDRDAVVDVESAANVAALGAGLKLENPRFAGTTDNGEPFVVTARSALPDGAMPDRIELELPEGEAHLSDGLKVKITANTGQMFRKDEQLHLNGDVVVETSNGYRAMTDIVELDLDTKTAKIPGAVRATGPLGGLDADRVHITPSAPNSKNVTVRFEGNVRVTYIPKSDE